MRMSRLMSENGSPATDFSASRNDDEPSATRMRSGSEP
jgi:hypothetical protein